MKGVDAAAERWRVLPFEVGAPRALLRRSAELLERLADDPVPLLRWYRATSTAIVLGRGQRDLAPARVPARPVAVEVVRRDSGGGAVLLTPDLLALDVLLPAGHPLLDGTPSAAFLPVGRAWAAALAELGVPGPTVHEGPSPARRAGTPRERLLAAVCYATLGRGEVSVHGRKLVGLAQRRRRHGTLVQCGLLRRWRPSPLLAALGADPDDAGVAAAAVGLDELDGLAPADGPVHAGVATPGPGHVMDAAIAERVSEHLVRNGGTRWPRD